MVMAAVSLTAIPVVATAGSGSTHAAVRQRVESSMLVRGEVFIEVDGSVSALQLHREEVLPPAVAKLVRDAVLQWRFEPVMEGGHVVRARAPMSLRVVARKLEGDQYDVSLRGVNFYSYESGDPKRVSTIDMKPPHYPEQAFLAGASGNVYLLVKIGRDGKVEDAFAEQVNLTFLSNEADQRRFRDVFAKSAVAAARRWRFRVPSEGEAAAQSSWNVRVPVDYSLGDAVRRDDDGYGRWVSYVPGPRERAPWRDETQEAGFSLDTLADGGIYMADDRGPHLLTPLQGG